MKIIRVPKFPRRLFQTPALPEGQNRRSPGDWPQPQWGYSKFQISKMTGLSIKRLSSMEIFNLLILVSDPQDPCELFSPDKTVDVVKAVLRFRGLKVLLGRRPARSMKMAMFLTHRFDSICTCGSFSISRISRRWCPICGVTRLELTHCLPPLPEIDLLKCKFWGFAKKYPLGSNRAEL